MEHRLCVHTEGRKKWPDCIEALCFGGGSLAAYSAENGKAYIRMADGVVRAFLPRCGDGLSGSFYSTRAARFLPTQTDRL
jgi:uncharacterized protein YyaL (SSP411 family)